MIIEPLVQIHGSLISPAFNRVMDYNDQGRTKYFFTAGVNQDKEFLIL